jgi:hypothetical protein
MVLLECGSMTNDTLDGGMGTPRMMPVPYAEDAMRTTIDIDDALFAELKRRATQQGTTIGRLIQDYVRFAIAECDPDTTPREPFTLVTFGGDEKIDSLPKASELIDRADIETYGHLGR